MSPTRYVGRRPARLLILAASGLLWAVAAGPPAGAHIVPEGYHVGNFPGTQQRTLRIYDETGSGSWRAADLRFAQNYLNYWAFWNRDRGVQVPYLDFLLEGGSPGCGNVVGGADICLGDPGAGNVGVARPFVTSLNHIGQGSSIIFRDGSTDRQKESLACQEISHFFGLAHNTENPNASSESCMFPSQVANPGVFYDLHDDVTLRNFYGSHLPH